VSLVVGLIGLAACDPRLPRTGEGQEPVTLEFWTLQMQPFERLIRRQIAAYERQHPGVRVHWVDIPFSEAEKRTLTALLSPKAPDVINLNPDFSALLAARQALLDMEAAVPDTIRAQYLPVAWQASQLSGRAFGIPWYLTSQVSFYNGRLLHLAGFQHPPATPADMARLGRALKSLPVPTYAVMPPLSENGYFLKYLYRMGVPLILNQRAVFADHGAAGHLKFWVDLYRGHLLPAESLTEGHRAAVDRYQAGTLAMMQAGPNFLKIVAENAPAVYRQTTIGPQLPTSPTGVVDFAAMVLVVPRQSRHPKEAVDFALYMTNADNQLALCREAPVLPSITSALKSGEIMTPQRQTEEGNAAADKIAEARRLSGEQLLRAQAAFPVHPRQHELNALMDFHVQSALLGRMTPQDAVKAAQERMNALLAEDRSKPAQPQRPRRSDAPSRRTLEALR
jgi:putative chitobiose transport system substrate-binding protein